MRGTLSIALAALLWSSAPHYGMAQSATPTAAAVTPMLTATPHANDTNATNATEMTFTPMLTPAPTPEIGLCNNGGSRGWLEKVTDGFHPILPFGPSGIHGRTYGKVDPSFGMSISITELADVGVFPPGQCCPQRYYPGRLYRITIDCPETCAFLMSVEYNDSDLSLGTDSYQNQVGTWPAVSLDSDPRVMRFFGAKDYNSVVSVGQLTSSLAKTYGVLWSAPPWEDARYAELEVRVTAVVDKDIACPGYYATAPLPPLVVCGDSLTDVVEDCDDANLEDGDGCDSQCYVEVGWTCDGRAVHPETGMAMSVCTKAAITMFPLTVFMEEGTTASYRFNLTTYVTAEVYVAVNNAFQGELSTQGNSVFKILPEDWDQIRTVTIEVLENNDVEGTRNYTMRHEVSGLDPNWMLELGSVPDVTVVVTDNDSIGLKIDPDVLELVELGDFQVYSVTLLSRPKGFVQVSISHQPPEFQMLFSPAVLVFDSGSWDIPQEVLVQAPDNNDIDGRVTVTAFHAVVSVQDPGYNFNGSTYNMTVLVDDNDSPGMRAVPRNVAVKEGTSGANYTISLLSQPLFGTNVTVMLNATCASEKVNECRLAAFGPDGNPYAVFGRNNWDDGVQITVIALDNTYEDGRRLGMIQHTIVTEDPNYIPLQANDPLAPWTVNVVVSDDDAAGIAHPDFIQLREGTGGATVTMRLLTTPYADVQVNLALLDNTWVSLDATSVKWTPQQWNETRNVTIKPNIDDLIFRDDIDTLLYLTSISDDPAYKDILKRPVPVTLVDNDSAGIDLGLGSSTSVLVIEAGDSQTLSVTLTSKPLANVMLTLTSGPQIRAVPNSMVFTPDNYAEVQQLRVEAVDDVEVEDDIHFDAIRIQVASSDPGYGVTDIAQVVRIRDNDASESTMLVGKWGGQVCPTAPCGQVLLIVPPLALRGDGLELGVNIAGSKLAPGVAGPVKGSKAMRVSGIFSFEPHGTAFERPVHITMEYDELASAIPGHELAFFKKNDPLSAGWQRVEGGVFNAGIAILRTSSLSLYFVGAILPNETTVYDDIVEELQCLEDEVDPQVWAALVTVCVFLGLEYCAISSYALWWCFNRRGKGARVAPAGAKLATDQEVVYLEGPKEDPDTAILALESPNKVDFDFTAEPPLPEDRPNMVGAAARQSRKVAGGKPKSLAFGTNETAGGDRTTVRSGAELR